METCNTYGNFHMGIVKFKIDLIVWKLMLCTYEKRIINEFKIDLIVWKHGIVHTKMNIIQSLKLT